MAVAPVEDVAGEEGGRHAEFLHAVQLVFARGLAVLDAVARVGARELALRLGVGVQDIVDGRVAVAVNGDLVARAVVLLHHFGELFAAAGRVAAVVRLAAGRAVVGRGEIAGVALDGAVLEQFHGGGADAVRVLAKRARKPAPRRPSMTTRRMGSAARASASSKPPMVPAVPPATTAVVTPFDA